MNNYRMAPLSGSRTSNETKQKFQSFQKYHGLWKSLSTDPVVVQEYQLLLKCTSAQSTQKDCGGVDNVEEEEKRKGESSSLGSCSNGSSGSSCSNSVHEEEEEDDSEEGDDDNDDDEEEEEEEFFYDQEEEVENFSPKLVTNENKNTKDETTSKASRISTTTTTTTAAPDFDFLSAIAATNNNQTGGQTVFKIVPSSCCGIIGCDNNCAEPILEEIEDEDQNDEVADVDSVEKEDEDDNIDDTQYPLIDDDEEEEEKMAGVENDNKMATEHNARAASSFLNTSFSPRSRDSSYNDESSTNGDTEQASNEVDADLSLSHNTSQASSKSSSSKLLSSSSTSSSSSSGGPSVIAFDLSHLSIHNTAENSECSEEGYSNSNIGASDDNDNDTLGTKLNETLADNESNISTSDDNDTVGTILNETLIENENNISALDENDTVGTILNDTLIENDISAPTTLQSASSTTESKNNESHVEIANFNDGYVDEVDGVEFKNEVLVRESFPPGDEHEEVDVKEVVIPSSSVSSSSSLKPNQLSFRGGFEKEIQNISRSISAASDKDTDEERGEDRKQVEDEEEGEESFAESMLSSDGESDASSSSSGGSTVVRFELDASLFVDDKPKENDKVHEEQSIQHGEDVDDADDNDDGNNNEVQEDGDGDHQSLVTMSSEEAEWTENEDNLSNGSISSQNDDEPSYNVVILSTDESIGEEESYEEDDSFELGNEESMESEFSNEESKSVEFDEVESDNNEFDQEVNDNESFNKDESGDDGYDDYDDEAEDEDSILIIESDEAATDDEDNLSVLDDNSIIEIGSKTVHYTSPSREEQLTAKTLSSHQKTKSVFKFQSHREQLTKSTFDQFNNIVFGNTLTNVQVIWSKRLTSTAGITRLRKRKTADNVEFSASIELSTKLIDKEERLRATLMHEMCHAAAWLVDNVHKPPHGKVFKKWANLAMRKINGLLVSTTHDYVTNTYKFAWTCTNEACDFIIQRHSRSVDVTRHCCGKCNSKLMEIDVPAPGSTTYVKKQKRKATGFSLFVQQRSQSVRASLLASRGPHQKVSQKDVMIECSRLWKELKAEGKA